MVRTLAKRPHLIAPTVYATLEATYLADKNYGNSHTGNDLANAYKHALWNVLIAYYCQAFYKNCTGSLAWAKRITDLHEDCFINHPAARNMDLVNNQTGRDIYAGLYAVGKRRPTRKALLDALKEAEVSLVFIEEAVET